MKVLIDTEEVVAILQFSLKALTETSGYAEVVRQEQRRQIQEAINALESDGESLSVLVGMAIGVACTMGAVGIVGQEATDALLKSKEPAQ